jgi:putative phosphoribosyl transferase
VRKLGVPFRPELAMGAVGEGGVLVVNERVVRGVHVREVEFADAEERERTEVERRARRFRGDRPRLALAGRTALVVDDGIATGSTARAACQAARAQGAGRIVLAVPVCARDAARALAGAVDEFACLEMPRSFFAVGQFYTDFGETSDDEVRALLEQAAGRVPASVAAGDPAAAEVAVDGVVDEEVEVTAGPVRLAGHLRVPVGGRGLVVFVHGSGSSRHSPRNRYVAGVLQRAGLGTLLFDLLTPDEERDRANVFDIELLAGRLTAVTSWVRAHRACRALPVGYFGASTGAAAALWAAAEDPLQVAAIVSRGGRPDLAGARLAEVRAATLLVVGGRDAEVLQLNEWARARTRCEVGLALVPGATHLFEEPGTLEQAAGLARDWFIDHLDPAADDRAIPVRPPTS